MRIGQVYRNRHIMLSAALLAVALLVGCAGQQSYSRHSGPGGGKGQAPTKEQLLAESDKDHDGRLSKTEFPGPDDHFSQLDTNSDGYLELDELPDGPPRRGGRG